MEQATQTQATEQAAVAPAAEPAKKTRKLNRKLFALVLTLDKDGNQGFEWIEAMLFTELSEKLSAPYIKEVVDIVSGKRIPWKKKTQFTFIGAKNGTDKPVTA